MEIEKSMKEFRKDFFLRDFCIDFDLLDLPESNINKETEC